MLNEKETDQILEEFFFECIKFWNRNMEDSIQAFKNAIRDIEVLTRDPNEPCGKLLDVTAQKKFIAQRKMYLEIFEI
jgi:hypothetical protein